MTNGVSRGSEDIMTVFEQIKANQEKFQKNMEKVQMQIDNHWKQQQSCHQNPVLEQIQGNQAKIQEDVAKIQVQTGKHADILKLLHNTDSYKIKPAIRKTIRFVIKNCAELFKQSKFNVGFGDIEVLGFSWYLQATTAGKKGFLSLHLFAKQPDGFNGNYRIEVDYRISVLNAFRGKDLADVSDGEVFKKDHFHSHWGWNMAEFKDLLNPAKGFLRPDGSIEVEADFTIKSSTLDHLIG